MSFLKNMKSQNNSIIKTFNKIESLAPTQSISKFQMEKTESNEIITPKKTPLGNYIRKGKNVESKKILFIYKKTKKILSRKLHQNNRFQH